MIKYDGHPNAKKRKDNKGMVTVECNVECISKAYERNTAADLASKNENNSRTGSKQSMNQKGLIPSGPKTMQSRRIETPEALNINVSVTLSEDGKNV